MTEHLVLDLGRDFRPRLDGRTWIGDFRGSRGSQRGWEGLRAPKAGGCEISHRRQSHQPENTQTMGSGVHRSEPRRLPNAPHQDGGPGTRGAVVLRPPVFHNRPHPAHQPVAFTPHVPDPEARALGGSAAAYAAWLEVNIELVDRLARATAHRARLSASETDDFLSDVHLKLVEDDFAVLRSFKGRSRLTTFLLTVLQRAAFDFRNARWGRWRASAQAERQGTTALRL